MDDIDIKKSEKSSLEAHIKFLERCLVKNYYKNNIRDNIRVLIDKWESILLTKEVFIIKEVVSKKVREQKTYKYSRKNKKSEPTNETKVQMYTAELSVNLYGVKDSERDYVIDRFIKSKKIILKLKPESYWRNVR